jgi:hypothetical protein
VRDLLAGLVDDAGLFPPEQLPMAAALTRHRADEHAGHRMLSHRFLCPASRIAELREESALREWSGEPQQGPADRGLDSRLRLGLILDTGLDGLRAALAEVADEPRLSLELLEVPAPSAEAVVAALDAVGDVEAAVFVEGPRDTGWVKAVAARHPPESGGGALRGAKVRCGGVRAELFPSPEELAALICACFEQGVPFKATAGLHGAVRHRDTQTGFVHHGFLNLLMAAVRAVSGAPADEVAAVLASTDGPALAAEARAVSGREVSAARLLFRAYGSCSTSEPREEATALRLLGPT